MELNRILTLINGGFASANNNQFVDYTGNVAYFLSKKISKYSEDKVVYFTCKNAYFSVDVNGFIKWNDGQWLDGVFFGDFRGGIFWNGQLHSKNDKVNNVNGRFFKL